MDIPDEAYAAARALGYSIKPRTPLDVALRDHGVTMVEAAAPHIDKAARIDELREQAKYLRKVAMDSPAGNGFSPGLLAAANWHEADADALEDANDDKED